MLEQLAAIATAIADGWRCDNLAPCLELIRQLAHGHPIPVMNLATSLDRSPEAIVSALQRLPDLERDEAGRIVGWGLTIVPTQHRFHVQGRTLFTWCALDTLMYPTLIRQPADVASPCPITGQLIRVAASSAGLECVDPPTAVVSIIIPRPDSGQPCDRDGFCRQVHFFSTKAATEAWLQEHPKGMIVSVDEAYQIGQLVVSYRYSETTVAHQ